MANNGHILIADDSETDRFLLERAFQGAGLAARLHFVEDGEEAIHYLAGKGEYQDRLQHPFPDLLLLDLKMPRRDGFDVLRWARAQRNMHRLIITVLTGSGQEQDVDQAYKLGANSFLVKPTFAEGMDHLVKRLHDYWMTLNCPPHCI